MNAPTTTTNRSILADRTYSISELAGALGTGTRPLYMAVRKGTLRAATVNDRGDLRVLGEWALAFLNNRVQVRVEEGK